VICKTFVMMQKVLLVGGTGEIGKEILKGLLEDGSFVRIYAQLCPIPYLEITV
jgi:FlaA1/EpsC-like NDP-sugar epimerase